jgi:hypothetical protein
MKIDIEKIQKKIRDELKELLKERINEKANTSTLKTIRKQTLLYLSRMTKAGLFKKTKVDNCKILWDTWNLKQKIIWFFKIKLKFGIAEYKKYNEELMKLYWKEQENKIDDYSLQKDYEREHKNFGMKNVLKLLL